MRRIKWFIKRLLMMSIQEVFFYRLGQFLRRQLINRTLYYFGNYHDISHKITVSESNFPIYNKNTINYLFSIHPFSEKIKLFQQQINIEGFSDWRKDIKDDITSPLNYYASINRQDFKINGDVKYVSEVSRLHFLPFMAFQTFLCKDDHISLKLEKILKEWLNQNPFYGSINWTSGIEVAIRIINVIYMHIVLRQANHLTNTIDILVKKYAVLHFKFLKENPSKFSSANNHLMAELSGLIIISSYFESAIFDKEFQNIEKDFFDQIDRQILDDGFNFELSTRYHVEVLDHVINAISFLKKKKRTIPIHIIEKVKKSFLIIDDLVSTSGIVSEFSDSDDGNLIFPYFEKKYSLYKSQLISASQYNVQTSVSQNCFFDFRNYLIFGEAGLKKYLNTEKGSTHKVSKCYPSGLCFMYGKRNDMKLTFDIGHIGDSINSAHGHADLLHFTFEKSSISYIIDPGTYQYHSKFLKWRNYFRSCKAHNTISVDMLDQAVKNTRMGWLKKPTVTSKFFTDNKDYTICSAEHNGFILQGANVKHSRKIINDKSKSELLIEDVLTGTGKHSCEFFLHLNPKLDISIKGDKLIASFNDKQLVISNSQFRDKLKLYKGDKDNMIGWYSQSYDKKEPCHTLVLTISFDSYLKLDTKILYSKA